jgi:CysZ protein
LRDNFIPLITDALSRAFRDLFQGQVLWLMVWPIVAASLLWIVLDMTFSSLFAEWVASTLDSIGIQDGLEDLHPKWAAHLVQALAHLILFTPFVFVTAVIMTALFSMPALVSLVSERDYPQLKHEKGGGAVGSLINVLLGLPIFFAIWMITGPLWLAGAGAILPFIAAAYLNQRMFRYDALLEHASFDELKTLFFIYRVPLWILGLVTSLVQFIPVFNLFAPVFTGLAFAHFGLARLDEFRQHPREVLLHASQSGQ